tara:strand:- start:317 stop:1120 length:804 start_codon:yes stop_codon:yes gene_type:complete
MKIEKLFSVQGKVAVVTGGGRGIGKMIASHLVQNGCKVYIASHPIDEQENIDTAKEIGCKAVPADVTNLESIRRLVKHISVRETHVDILVNNAGVARSDELEYITEETYDLVHGVNQKAILFMVQQFLPLLEGGASVINLSSVVGSYNTPATGAGADYMSAKAGQNRMTAMLAQQLAGRKITVNGIAPGATETSMLGQPGITYDQNIYINKINPLKRFVEPQDVGSAVIYLSSKAGSYMTGQILVLDGGVSQSQTNSDDWVIWEKKT